MNTLSPLIAKLSAKAAGKAANKAAAKKKAISNVKKIAKKVKKNAKKAGKAKAKAEIRATRKALKKKRKELQPYLKEFWERGFVVLKDVVPKDKVDAFLSVAEDRDLEYTPIFKSVFSDNFDERRLQALFPDQPMQQFQDVQDAVRSSIIIPADMQWIDRKWTILKSLAGGGEQDSHQDFPRVETSRARKDKDTIQAGLLVGLMPDTHIIVYEGCFAEADAEKRLKVGYGPGDVVLFRGDLVHAGAAFPDLNYRVHTNLTVDGIEWDQNATEFAPPKVYKCKMCPFRAPLKHTVHNHWRCCKQNKHRGEIALAYKKRNELGGTCDVCKRFFSLRNTMIKHQKKCALQHQEAKDTKGAKSKKSKE